MAVANTIAYCDTTKITALKSFVIQVPGVTVIKVFMSLLIGQNHRDLT
jgi:hypothetical protein